MAKRMKREKKPLRSLAILNERSALPAFTARAAPAPACKPKLSGKEKARLRRIAGRTEDGSADVRKTSVASLHDAWVAAPAQEGLLGGFGDEAVIKHNVKTPETLQKLREERRALIEAQLEAELPVAGVSYNPAAEAHAALMKKALEEELALLKKEEREAKRIETLGEVIVSRRENDNEFSETVVGGMKVGRGDGFEEESEEEEEDGEGGYKPKPTKRKTQAQRNKAARAKAKLLEARAAAERKKTEQAILAAKKINKDVEARQKAAAEAARLRKLAAEERARPAFEGGEKIGKHRVEKGAVAVQLGEDLAESLRQVKVSASVCPALLGASNCVVRHLQSLDSANPSPRATSSRTASCRCKNARSSSPVCGSCRRSACSRSSSTRSTGGRSSSSLGTGSGCGPGVATEDVARHWDQ